jgi:hypothetical protein
MISMAKVACKCPDREGFVKVLDVPKKPSEESIKLLSNYMETVPKGMSTGTYSMGEYKSKLRSVRYGLW